MFSTEAPLRPGLASPASMRVAIVGSGPSLVKALDGLGGIEGVRILMVIDVSGNSEGSRLAVQRSIPCERNPMEVFRTEAEVILEVNGDVRQYERLLAVKPPSVEVLSVRGVRLFLDLLARPGGSRVTRPLVPGPAEVLVIVARARLELHEYLEGTLGKVEAGVEVFIDRRRAERRARARAYAMERRHGDRRHHPDVDAALRSHGFAVTRRETAASPT